MRWSRGGGSVVRVMRRDRSRERDAVSEADSNTDKLYRGNKKEFSAQTENSPRSGRSCKPGPVSLAGA